MMLNGDDFDKFKGVTQLSEVADTNPNPDSQLAPPADNPAEPTLNPKHELILRHLVIDGLKATDVANKFEVTDSWISIMRRTPEWRKRIEELKEMATEGSLDRLRSFQDKALDGVEESLISDNEHIKLKSALEVLDRTGIGSTTEENSTQPSVFHLYLPGHYNN